MTKREFYELIASNETLDQEVRDFAANLISKLDTSLDKRNSKANEKKVAENTPLFSAIMDFLTSTSEVKVASEIASAINISTQKASALLRQLVENGVLIMTQVKVKGGRVVNGFRIATTEGEN